MNENFKYRQRVMIRAGFYAGCIGTLTEYVVRKIEIPRPGPKGSFSFERDAEYLRDVTFYRVRLDNPESGGSNAVDIEAKDLTPYEGG